MATRLADFSTAVHARLTAAGITDVAKRDDREAIDKHDLKRRIVWITEGGTIEPPRQAGGRLNGAGSSRVVACKMRVEEVDAYIFGGTREATEDLLDAVIAAAFIEGGAHLEMTRYRWLSQEDNRSGTMLRTQLCVLRMLLRLPVSEEITPLTALTGQDHECGTLDEDGDIVPQ